MRRHINPSLVISCIALFVALGGASYAAVKIPKNSVGNAQLKKNAVTGAKVKSGSLRADDFMAGQLPQGERGADGATGPQGPPGPSTGTAGGDLAGSYPNPTIRNGSVTTSMLATVPAARLKSTGGVSVPNSTNTEILANSVRFDTAGLYKPAIASNSLIAPVAGIYQVSANVSWDANAVGDRELVLNKGIAQIGVDTVKSAVGTSTETTQSLSVLAAFNEDEILSAVLWQNSGGPIACYTEGLSMVWVAPLPAS